MTIPLYHNPRCSKSRATLEIIQSKGITPNIVEYLHTPPDPDTLEKIARLIGVPLGELLRRDEDDFVAAGDDVPLDDETALARWLYEHPSVLERPIVVDNNNDRAIVGRPPNNVNAIL